MSRASTYTTCRICGKEFQSLGFPSHRSACYRKLQKKRAEEKEKEDTK